MFLSIEGPDKKDAQRQFISACNRASKIATGRRVENIAYPIDHVEVIALWSSDAQFLDILVDPSCFAFVVRMDVQHLFVRLVLVQILPEF
jgi:hypothetical protein